VGCAQLSSHTPAREEFRNVRKHNGSLQLDGGWKEAKIYSFLLKEVLQVTPPSRKVGGDYGDVASARLGRGGIAKVGVRILSWRKCSKTGSVVVVSYEMGG